MNQLDLDIQDAISKACKACFEADVPAEQVQVQRTRKDFDGDRTVVVFPLTRLSKKSPEETAEMLGAWLVDQDERMTHFQVVKGFLNLSVSTTYWAESLDNALQTEGFGTALTNSKSRVMVEFSSPNTNKPLHLGHLRNIFLGFSVSQILKAAGHQVVKVQIINDRGIHICKSMVAWKHFGEGATPETTGLKGDKLVGKYYVAFDKAYKEQVKQAMSTGTSEAEAKESAPLLAEARTMLQQWEQGDAETMALWTTMNQWVYDGFETTYAEMGVTFDQLYYESNTYLLGRDEVLSGVKQGAFNQREDGSIWVDLSDAGLDEKLLLRKDGTAVYMTQDIGTAIQRYKDFPGLDRQIYTVGNEQEYHFKVLFKVLEKLGIQGADRNFHLSYGMVELPEGKMKSREGTVVDADELMQEMARTAGEMAQELGKTDGLTDSEKEQLHKTIGYGALKYFLLKVSPTKSMMFDPKASIDFIGNTGPFIQFNYVRALSVLKKAEGQIVLRVPKEDSAWDATELQLIQSALEWPEMVQAAAKTYDPSIIANYCYDLTKSYSRWYQDHPVLKEPDASKREARLAICAICERNIKSGMTLLGIQMPDRM
ncbi:MAG: arginine--tRNA ligase [Flavobacteriales bacterium]|nr:arginine--tRNA ligase [Flavobacteriales bacterium]